MIHCSDSGIVDVAENSISVPGNESPDNRPTEVIGTQDSYDGTKNLDEMAEEILNSEQKGNDVEEPPLTQKQIDTEESTITPIMVVGAYLNSCDNSKLGAVLCSINADFLDVELDELDMEIIDVNGIQVSQENYTLTIVELAGVLYLEVLTSSTVKSVSTTVNRKVKNCNFIEGSGIWVFVPGDSVYNTGNFCVMKYEAKIGPAGPISLPQDTPWVNISQLDAIAQCDLLGEGYHLITNEEWMTIGSNIVHVASNWSNGVIGSGQLKVGHTDENPANACAADVLDSSEYVEGSCVGSSSGIFTQGRTNTLSNGEVIWDFAGNTWEWVDYFNDEDKPYPNSGILDNNWYEYTYPIIGSTTMPLSALLPQIAIENSWNSSQSVGFYRPAANGEGGALLRGGFFRRTDNSGLFSAAFNNLPTSSNSVMGFRCVLALE